MHYRLLLLVTAFGLALAVSACGESEPSETRAEAPNTTTEEPSSEGSPTTTIAPGWTAQELAPPVADRGVVAATASGTRVVVSADETGLVAWFDHGQGFTAATVEAPTEPSEQGLSVAAVIVADDGFLAAANTYDSFVPQLWFSPDGTSWSPMTAAGIDQPAEVLSIVDTETATFVVGALRVGDEPGSGPFQPMMWRSTDLESWTQVGPTDVSEGNVYDLVEASNGLLAIGRDDAGATVWRSTDGGRSWTRGTAPDAGDDRDGLELYDLARSDDRIVGVGETWSTNGDGEVAIVTTDDGGVTWSRQSLDPGVAEGLERGYRVLPAGDAFWLIASRWFDTWSDTDRCYADLDACLGGSTPVLLRSDDGTEWSEVDLTGLELPEHFGIDTVTGAGAGVSVVGTTERLTVWTWPTSNAPPLRDVPPPVATPELELVRWDADLELGVTYRFPLYIHCGMGYLGNFNGTHWYLSDAPQGEVETGAGETPDPDWPTAQQSILGRVTLVDDDTIEYTIPSGEVIGIYESSGEQPPGCD